MASPLFMFGQKYFPIPTQKAKWMYGEPGGQVGLPGFVYNLYSGPDSFFNGFSYHSVLGGGTDYWFREESKKIYNLNIYDSTETILYDFNLAVGDTFFYNPYKIVYDSLACIVKKIDSVLVLHHYHKRYLFYVYPYPYICYWVEGIGTLNNLFGNPFQTIKAMTQKTLCNFYMNDSFAYYDNFFCGPEAVASVNPEPLEIQFYPNPASDILYINALKNYTNFQIIDIIGRVILTKKLYTGNSILNIEEILQGMYYIKVENGFVGKFVKL